MFFFSLLALFFNVYSTSHQNKKFMALSKYHSNMTLIRDY